MKDKTIKELCEQFMKQVGKKYQVYNEVSLQFELGKYIQDKLGQDYCVQFERNVYGIFGKEKPKKGQVGYFVKSESDIVIFKKPEIMDETKNGSFPMNSLPEEEKLIKKSDELCFIEVKFPRNEAYPRMMWQFLEDISFCDKLFDETKVKETACIAMVDKFNNGFHEKKRKDGDKPYCYFRGETTTIPERIDKTEYISKPELAFRRDHKISWNKERDYSYYTECNIR